MAISVVALYLTEACNLRCRYCFLHKQPRRLPLELGREVVDFMLAAPPNVDPVKIYFFGGEPLLESDTIRELTLYGEKRSQELGRTIRFGVTTNGTLLTDDILDFLFDHRISINLSLDGRPETQDANRRTADGRGSFALVDDAIDKIVARNPSQGARMTYDSQSIGSLYEDHRYLWSRGITNTSPIAVLEDGWTEETMAVAKEQFGLIARAVLEEMRAGRLKVVGFLGKYSRRIATYKRRKRQPCGICSGYIGISVDGTIYPCQRFAACGGYPFGDLNKVTAQADRHMFLNFDSDRLNADCDGCPARMVCAGGCPALNYVCTGDIYEPWPTQCAFIRMEHETAEWLYGRLKDEENPLLDRMLRQRQGRRKSGRTRVANRRPSDAPREAPVEVASCP